MTAGPVLAQRLLYTLAGQRVERGTTGGFISGPQLSEALGVSRTAIWKAVGALRDLGVEIEALPRQGYRLAEPCSPLSVEGVRAALRPEVQLRLQQLRVSWTTGSTNADLLRELAPAPGFFALHVADYQSAGRGRRGRSWIAPPGGAICLSWSWRFDALPSHAASLSLALGISAVRTLESFGIEGVGLKWPNDLVTSTGKLAGILIEMVSEAGGPALVVVGLGLNVALGRGVRDLVAASGTQVADLQRAGGPPPPRNELVAALVGDGVEALLHWERDGFVPLTGHWQQHDVLRGREIVLRTPAAELRGIARGVDASGALLVDDGQRVHHCSSGEASVRIDS
jgi:BirA family biotin operon repressor/biotin-[acetyl-CoA-carboxylase] ligase